MTGERGSDAVDDSPGSLPLPMVSRALIGLLVLAVIYTFYFAKTLLVTLVVALLFALLLNPLVEILKRLYIPRTISALLILCAFGGPFVLLAMELVEPAQKWSKRLPELTDHLRNQVSSFTAALQTEDQIQPAKVSEQARHFSFLGLFAKDRPEPDPLPVEKETPTDKVVNDKIVQGSMETAISVLVAAPLIIVQLLTCVILILFLLIFGPNLFNVAVDIFPQVKNKHHTILMVTTIRQQLSRYILTVSAINVCLALVTGGAFWWLGVEDALLWGVLVGLLNFAPYVGPLMAFVILCLAGLSQYGFVAFAMVPALVYFTINLVEAQFFTPMVLGYNMLLNPLILMVWLVFWSWLWGVMGVLLAVPLLVCTKIALDQLSISPAWVRLMETRA